MPRITQFLGEYNPQEPCEASPQDAQTRLDNQEYILKQIKDILRINLIIHSLCRECRLNLYIRY